MIDLHTHILPAMDDGAKTLEDSLTMLRMEADQGVDWVALTPHMYRDREDPVHFLRRRREAMMRLEEGLSALPQEERNTLPKLMLGAEVAWWPDLAQWEELPRLCLGESRYLLLELPFQPWGEGMIRQLYDLMGQTGITPVIAHLERYVKLQPKTLIQAVLDLGVPVQVSSGVLLRPLARGKALDMLRRGEAQILASDCHDPTRRPPDLGKAIPILQKKLGEEEARQVLNWGENLTGRELNKGGMW